MLFPAAILQTGAAMRRTVLAIFLSALTVRLIYSAGIYAWMGNAGILGVDSGDYVDQGRILANAFLSGALQGWDWLGPKPIMMPLYSWMLAASVMVAGTYAPLLHVIMQGVADSITCVLIYGIAHTIDRRFASPAAIAAIVNPTMIVIAGQVYPDTPFVLFVTLFLFGAARWLRTPSWPAALTIAAGIALCSWFRILVTPYVLALVIFMLIAVIVTSRFRWLHVAQLSSVLVIFILSLAPISLRNFSVYNSWALTPQVGMHLSRWIVPLVWETNGKMPWASGYLEMERRADKLPHTVNENPFHQSSRYTAVSIDALKDIGAIAVAKAWLYGAAVNLGTPAIILSPPIAGLPRTGFYATTSSSALGKIRNFVFHSDNRLYSYVLLAGICGVALVRLVQLLGMFNLLRKQHIATMVLLVSWSLFVLVVNGPVASPKYRLPIEPVFAIFTGAGYAFLQRGSARATSQA